MTSNMKNKNAPVSDIMTPSPVTVAPDETLTVIKEIFEEHNFRHIPVCENNKPVGIVSRTDFMLVMMGVPTPDQADGNDNFNALMFDALEVNQIMTENIVSVRPDESIQRVGQIFTQNRFHALPVVENEKLVGIVTTIDVVRYFTEDE